MAFFLSHKNIEKKRWGGGVGKEKRKKKDRVLHIVENTHIYIICKCLKNGGTDPLFY